MLKNKRIFVSGGSGVIGTALVEKLYGLGAILLVGDLKPRPASWPAGIRYRQGDLNYIAKEELDSFAPEYFFHLAATFERSTEEYGFWEENFQHNIRLSHHLVSCLKDAKELKKVVFASSYLIYDPSLYTFDQPAATARRLKETDPILPRNLCGVAKLLGEMETLFLSGFDRAGFDAVCARIFRSYGKNSRDVVSRWIRALLKRETLTVYNAEGLFDYIYAEEVAEGLIRLAASDARGVVNLGRDGARSVARLLEILRGHFPEMKTVDHGTQIDYEASQADMDRFFALTGWKPGRSLEDVVPELIAFEKNRDHKESQPEDNVLVTSVAAKVPLVRSLRQGMQKMGGAGKVTGGDTDANCIARHFTDSFWRMPPLPNLTPQDLIDYCRSYNITRVIPTRDGELPFFAAHKHRLAESGIKVMVSGLDTVNICRDKLLFARTLAGWGFPVIETAARLDGLEGRSYVVKERFGAGSRNIGLDLGREEAAALGRSLAEPVYQPFVAGREVSVDLYVDAGGTTKGVVVRSRDVVKHGESQVTTTVRDPALEDMCSDLAGKLAIYGHAVLQVLIDGEGNYHIVECNCRFGGASSLSLEAGLDSFYWFLLESAGSGLDQHPFLRSPVEKRQVRYAADLVIHQ